MNRYDQPGEEPRRDAWSDPRQRREPPDTAGPTPQWGPPNQPRRPTEPPREPNGQPRRTTGQPGKPAGSQFKTPGQFKSPGQQWGPPAQEWEPPAQQRQEWASPPEPRQEWAAPPPQQWDWAAPLPQQQEWASPAEPRMPPRQQRIANEQDRRAPTKPPRRRRTLFFALLLTGMLLVVLLIGTLAVFSNPVFTGLFGSSKGQAVATATRVVTPTPTPFDPNVGAILPGHRIVAYYGIPNAEPPGPAFELTTNMLNNLQAQGAAYQQLDPGVPVQLGIDLVASVADGFPGPDGYYSHDLDPDTIQAYIDFCQKNNLILFLDLQIGLAPIMQDVDNFLPYLEKYTFVELAVDPEWMFPRHNGIPGINLSNIRASDLNPIIEAVAEIPMKYHVPRKILMFHQYRGDGDGLANPYDAGGPGVPEYADKSNLLNDPRVDVVIHTDGVGGYNGDVTDKTYEYEHWVAQDMQQYQNFRYGGFKLFYNIEANTLMTPQQVLALTPAPTIITYGN